VFTLPAVAFGVLGIIAVVGMRTLQIVTTLRQKTTAGRSSWSWIILTVNCTAWGLYGALAGLWPLVVTSVLAGTNSTVLQVTAQLNSAGHTIPSRPTDFVP
jgi:uncharacterized protein with PQ loop repeat